MDIKTVSLFSTWNRDKYGEMRAVLDHTFGQWYESTDEHGKDVAIVYNLREREAREVAEALGVEWTWLKLTEPGTSAPRDRTGLVMCSECRSDVPSSESTQRITKDDVMEWVCSTCSSK